MSPDQFNNFHLAVACISERLRWVFDRLPPVNDPDMHCGIEVFAGLLDDLDAIVEDQVELMAPRSSALSVVVDFGPAREL